MPGETGVTVVTTLVCFVLFRTRGCGRIKRPAFPAPSDLKGGCFCKNSGESRRENAEWYLKLFRLFENLNRPRVQNSRRPGQASIASADPGPITTDVCCYAKLGLQRAHQLAFVVMGPRFRGDDKCRQSDLSAVAR